MHRILQPEGWVAPRGYSHGVAAQGTIVSIAGQIGYNAQGQLESDDFGAQARQALANVLAVLLQAGGGPQHIVRMNWYMTSRAEYMAAGKALAAAYRELMTGAGGKLHFPAMTAVEVTALMEPRAKIEIEATAVVPG
jgi:enamine deaminase RidA (YjgF/YER057c/UK114 family)